MKVGDIITPCVSRFPLIDREGNPTHIEDEALGKPARIIKAGRHVAEVVFLDTGKEGIYRYDEIKLISTKGTSFSRVN